MEQLSIITKWSLLGTVVFGILSYVIPREYVYETVEMEVVSFKKVFLVLAIVCLGFLLASIFLW